MGGGEAQLLVRAKNFVSPAGQIRVAASKASPNCPQSPAKQPPGGCIGRKFRIHWSETIKPAES